MYSRSGSYSSISYLIFILSVLNKFCMRYTSRRSHPALPDSAVTPLFMDPPPPPPAPFSVPAVAYPLVGVYWTDLPPRPPPCDAAVFVMPDPGSRSTSAKPDLHDRIIHTVAALAAVSVGVIRARDASLPSLI